MSYSLDLEEYPEEALRAELLRRQQVRGQGFCDYCEKPLGSAPVCKFPERHTPHPIRRTVTPATGEGWSFP